MLNWWSKGRGLFRRKPDPVGQSTEPMAALSTIPSAERRLDHKQRLLFECDLAMQAMQVVCEQINELCGDASWQRFTEHNDPGLHVFFMSNVCQYWTHPSMLEFAAMYIEHPETFMMVPLVRAIEDRRKEKGGAVVWFHGGVEPILIDETTRTLVTDVPYEVNKTLDQLEARYG
jgi:hypothetical protein